MQDSCPLCLQNDKKSKIKLLQINFEEAIWSCESEKCAWPFGYEKMTYFPRKVGKTWSYHWDDHSPRHPFQHNTTLLKETRVLAAAKNNIKDEVEDIIIKSEEQSSWSLEIKRENLVEIEENFCDTQAMENLMHTVASSAVYENGLIEEEKDLYFDTMDDDKESIELIEDIKVPIKEENQEMPIVDSFQNLPNAIGTTRVFPQITRIEKTNIDISSLRPSSQVPPYSNTDNETKPFVAKPKNQNLQTKPVMCITIGTTSNTSTNITKKPLIKVPEKVNPPRPQSRQIKQSQPPVVQSCNKAPTTCAAKGGSLKALKAEILQSRLNKPIKKLSSGKGYDKFSFSVIKKQMETKEKTTTKNISKNLQVTEATIGTNDTIKTEIKEEDISEIKDEPLSPDTPKANSNESQNVLLNEQTKAGTGSVLLDTGISIKTEEISDIVVKSEFPHPEGIALSETNNCNDHQFNTTLDSTSASIDIVIDDLLNIDHSISENISDDWISSLLI